MEMKVVTEAGQLNAFLQKNLKPSEIITYGESIKELIEHRHVFLRGEDAFVALRSMQVQGRLHLYFIHEFCKARQQPRGLIAVRKYMEPDEVFEFMKQGGNFFDVPHS